MCSPAFYLEDIKVGQIFGAVEIMGHDLLVHARNSLF